MNIKVKDLADMLNLSSSTVSMVLNNRPGISEVTRNKVRQAVIDLGYENLLVNDTEEKKNILFVVYRKHGIAPASTPYFSQLFSEIIEGVESQIKARGYNLMISYIDEKTIFEEAERIKKEKVHGVLVLATEMKEEQITAFENSDVPLVIMDNYMEHKDFNCVTINNEKGVYLALKHFVEMGHKEIGYLHITDNANNFYERYFAFFKEMQRNGLEIKKENILDIVTEGGEAVYLELKHKLQELKKLPTAFFADNDIVAMCAMRVFRELGYKIPEDISIIGFDNMVLSEMLDPPLTTIQIPKHKMGVIAANTIIDINEELDGYMKIEVGTKLIVRKSVKSFLES